MIRARNQFEKQDSPKLETGEHLRTFVAVCGGLWRFVVVCGGLLRFVVWWFVVVCGGLWWCVVVWGLAVCGCLWWFVVVCGGVWWRVVVWGLAVCGCLWWFVVVCGGLWWCVVVWGLAICGCLWWFVVVCGLWPPALLQLPGLPHRFSGLAPRLGDVYRALSCSLLYRIAFRLLPLRRPRFVLAYAKVYSKQEIRGNGHTGKGKGGGQWLFFLACAASERLCWWMAVEIFFWLACQWE